MGSNLFKDWIQLNANKSRGKLFTQYLSVSLVCFVFFFITTTVSFAAIIYVPVDVDSIQGGINLAQDGDTVLVAPGIYQESINFFGKDIVVMSELGMDSTVIHGDSTQRVITFENGESYNAMLIGFTIENGDGGIICANYSNPIILQCKIRNNNATTNSGLMGYRGGGGLACINSSPLIMNSIIYQNETLYGLGGGILTYQRREGIVPLKLVNCVVYNNQTSSFWGANGIHIISEYYNDFPLILNSIIWENDIYFNSTISSNVLFCNVQGGWDGEGNIDQIPQFVDAENGDFHLQPTSPCINAGHPMTFFNNTDDTRNDIGAYGGSGFAIEIPRLYLGQVALQTIYTYPFNIYNLRNQPLSVTNLAFSNPGIFTSNLSLPFEIPAFTIQEVPVTFEPDFVGTDSSELLIHLTDETHYDSITITIKGEGMGVYGHWNFTRKGYMDAGLVSTVLYNFSEIGDWMNEPFNSGVWPKGTYHTYLDGAAFIIQAETEDIYGNTIHPMETNYYEYTIVDPATGITYGWWPIPGYFNPFSNAPAMSDQPQTWPTRWPNRTPEWEGYWDGFFGRGITIADQETFFVMDDYSDQQWDYYPVAADTSRGGLGIVVEVRGYAWADPQYEDILIWHYTIKNISDFDYQKVVVGFYVDPGIGGHDDSSDDCGTYLPEQKMVYYYDYDGIGQPGAWSPVGLMGFKFLEMPGNPYDGLDNDGDRLIDESRDNGIDDDSDWNPVTDDVGTDGIQGTDDFGEGDGIPTIGEPNFDKTDPEESDDLSVNTVRFFPTHTYDLDNAEENWQVFTSSVIDNGCIEGGINLASFIISQSFPLHSGETTYFSMVIVFGEDLDDLLNNVGAISSLSIDKDDISIIPQTVQLYQNYPNPFNPMTTINYQLPKDSYVTLKIYDILGREIRTLTDREMIAGNYNINWDSKTNAGKSVASGVYIYQLKVGDFQTVRKMVLLR